MRLDFLSAAPDRAGIGAQIEQRAHAVAKHKGQQGDRAGIDDGGARPAEHKGQVAPKGTLQKMVVAASAQVSGAQLGMAQRAGDRDQRTGHLQNQSPTRVTADTRHQRRGFENTGTNDDTNDQRQGRQGMKPAQRLVAPAVGLECSQSLELIRQHASITGAWLQPAYAGWPSGQCR